MGSLELKVPPAAVMVAVAVLMWMASRAVPSLPASFAARAGLGVLLAVAGFAFAVAGIASFRRARTTVDPMHPDSSSALVVSGVYRHSRNPIYLGMLLLLLGWAAFLANILALAVAFLFIPYMDRFQIEPEERALSELFGDDYSDYRSRVRRWI